MIRTLTFTTLFPNAAQPRHGLFVAQRLRHLLASGEVETRILAPVPWFPWSHPRFGAYAAYARVPRQETWEDHVVKHPPYPLIPKIGMSAAPLLLALAALPHARRVLAEGFDFDLIDAHYFYPDGVAATLLGKWLDKPVVITGRGTDLNLIPRHALPRAQIQWAARRAAGLVTVCRALADPLLEMGISPDAIHVLRNGVDLERFRPLERAVMRKNLGMAGNPCLLSVGHLIPRKGHDLAIRALMELPQATLWIVGEGPLRSELEALAQNLGVAGRVRMAGAVEQARLPGYYSAADMLVLASDREGWANVLLESMACGTPVVATALWGTPEVVCAPAAGVLMAERTPAALAEGVRRLWGAYPAPEAVRRHAEGFSWEETTRGQLALFRQILGPSSEPRGGLR